ncbi:MAG: YitT family protein [Erysipelotrichaceae bacterium]|jgi:uncharacterized membrane-anchored protein YitT (DUF2179 family)|nr:YitT family protein [Erysipelotrichaceae bacterium]
MSKLDRIKKNINTFLYRHLVLRFILHHGKVLIVVLLSALLYSFGFRSFISPIHDSTANLPTLVGGGVTGVAQVIVKLVLGINPGLDTTVGNIIQSVLYTALNIPLFILAYLKIGKQFSIYTFINVVASSILVAFLPEDFIQIISHTFENNILPRALLGGLLAGLSTTLAFSVGASAGGIDLVSFYFANRKSTNVGKYMIFINIMILTAYTITSMFLPGGTTILAAFQNVADGRNPTEIMATYGQNPHDYLVVFGFLIIIVIFSVLYIVVSGIVVDNFNARNKKIQIKIVTTRPTLSEILINHFPHSATVLEGTGAYSKEKKYIIYMVVSSNEEKEVVKKALIADPSAFIETMNINQAYGNFFIRRVK